MPNAAPDTPNWDARYTPLHDDWLTVTGSSAPLEFARDLHRLDPDTFDFETGAGSRNYSRSLVAPNGIRLSYGIRTEQRLDAEQSDTRDASGWCLEVPGHAARDLLPRLRLHPAARSMQVSRRDVALTWCPADPAHVYAMWDEWVRLRLRRDPHKEGPRNAEWESVSLYTHPLRRAAGTEAPPRTAILYDKHARSPDEFPDHGTLRWEVRFRPPKSVAKVAAFWATPEQMLDSWTLSRGFLGILRRQTRSKSFQWLQAAPDDDLDRLTLSLLRSYAPTIAKGIARFGGDYLHTVALAAALLQARPTPQADAPASALMSAPELIAARPELESVEAR